MGLGFVLFLFALDQGGLDVAVGAAQMLDRKLVEFLVRKFCGGSAHQLPQQRPDFTKTGAFELFFPGGNGACERDAARRPDRNGRVLEGATAEKHAGFHTRAGFAVAETIAAAVVGLAVVDVVAFPNLEIGHGFSFRWFVGTD